MKQTILNFLASHDRNNVVSGPIIQWLIASVIGVISYSFTRYLSVTIPEDKILLVSGALTIFIKERLSAWVAINMQSGVKDLQRKINAAGVAEEIPVDGVPGPVTIQAQKETLEAK